MIVQIVTWRLRHEISPPRENRLMADLINDLTEWCHKEGIEILTDQDRTYAGLPPRDAYGWTAQELAILEHARVARMMEPISMIVPDEEKKT